MLEQTSDQIQDRNRILTQGYGADSARIITLRSKCPHRYAERCGQESAEAEFSAGASPNNKPTSVHSRNSATGEEL
jgi:hypothetical protein